MSNIAVALSKDRSTAGASTATAGTGSSGDGNERDQAAMEYFEQAIDKESHGSMSDAIELYRRAFKLNEKVDLLYRQTKLPGKLQQLRESHGQNSVTKLDEDKIKAINVDNLLQTFEYVDAKAPDPNDPDQVKSSGDELIIKFANLGTDNHEKVITKPVSPLVHLPNDIWVHIMELLLVDSPESWIEFSMTCKKFAYLGLHSSDIWRKLCYLVYPLQHYEENKTFLESNKMGDDTNVSDDMLPIPKDQLKIVSSFDYSWKQMLSSRPFVKFNGCYISVVNYYSEGSKADFSSSWSNPVRTITYYRYLRFYPDGTCCMMLTSLEPYSVVPYLLKRNLLRNITSASDQAKVAAHLSSVKESNRIYHGAWTMSTTGEIAITIEEGSVPYYTFHYYFQVKSLSKVFKYNKLNWIKYYTVRKQMSDDDDRVGEVSMLPLSKEKPFKFLRVKSYNIDN